MNTSNTTFLLRIALAIILLTHSIPGMFDNGINNFGNLYLDPIGFGSFGIVIAWVIKLSHIVAAYCLVFDKYVKLASLITIFIFLMGILMVHIQHGWYVVGGGSNGVEYNFLLIIALLTVMFPKGIRN